MSGISRKLPENERTRLKKILKQVVPEDSGVIVHHQDSPGPDARVVENAPQGLLEIRRSKRLGQVVGGKHRSSGLILQ